MKIIPGESENSALFSDVQLTCTRCALIEAAAINRRGRPQSWHLLSQHPFASETDVAGRRSGVVRDGKWRKWRWKGWLLARCCQMCCSSRASKNSISAVQCVCRQLQRETV
jgi:hypothetical protein